MKTSVIILILIFICMKMFATEYVRNNSFELNSGLPQYHSSVSLVNYWKSSDCSYDPSDPTNVNIQHSADYFYNDPSSYKFLLGGGPSNFLPPHTGKGSIGMSNYEMIKQQFASPLEPGNQYIFSMYVHSGDIGQFSSTYNNLNSSLIVYLSEDEPFYDDEPNCNKREDPCTFDYRTIGASNLRQLRSLHLTDVKFSNYESEWVQVSFMFTCPYEVDIFGGNPTEFDWIAIDLTLDTYSNSTGGWSDCYQSYLLLDDISVTDFCDNFCVNPNRGDFTFGISSHGTWVPNSWAEQIGFSQNGSYQIFFTFITNANYVFFEVYDRNSHPMYTAEYFDTDHLHDPNFSDFLLKWDGKRNNGDCEVYNDVYNARLLIRNCSRVFDQIIPITIWDASGTCESQPVIKNYDLSQCCPYNATIDNVFYSADSRVDVQNRIDVAQTGGVWVGNNVNVKFHAGNEIVVGPNFLAGYGSDVEMKIVPCGTLRLQNIGLTNDDSRLNFDSYKTNYSKVDLIVYPNPTSGIIFVSIPDLFKEAKLNIIDPYGSQVALPNKYINSSNVEIDVKNLAPGVYSINLIQGDIVATKRFIKL